jgi:hypothetical protein
VSSIAMSVILSEGVVRETDDSVVEGPRALYTLEWRFREFYPVGAGRNAYTRPSEYRQIGVLRLRDCFALRSSPFAQDDMWLEPKSRGN